MLLIIGLLTLTLSLVLIIFNWQVNKNALYLGFAFISISIYCIAHYLTVYGKSAFWLAVVYNHFAPLNLLAGPFLYLYVRGTLTDNAKLDKMDWVHFLPAILQFIGIIPWFFVSFDEKMAISQEIIEDVNKVFQIKMNFIFTVEAAYIARPLLLLGYTLYAAKELWKFSPFNKVNLNTPSNQLFLSYKWLVFLLSLMTILSLSYTILTFQFLGEDINKTLILSGGLNSITGGVLGIITLILLFFPQILYGMPAYRTKNAFKNEAEPENVMLQEEKKGEDINLSNPFEELVLKIHAFLQMEKPYIDPDFSVESLAKSLDVPLNHVTYCLNEIMQTKFTVLRQKYRIDYAKQLLRTDTAQHYTIEAIALQSGFSTRSSFYNAFKVQTGMTPTEFITSLGQTPDI